MDKYEKFYHETMQKIPNIPYGERHPKYKYIIGSGASKKVIWQNTTLLRPTSPPTCHCVGIVFEYLIDVLKATGDEYGIEMDQIEELQLRTMLSKSVLEKAGYDMSPESDIWWGAPQTLIDNCWAFEVKDPEEARMGDICQLWNWRDATKEMRTWGHCMILTGEYEMRKSRKCIMSMGATVQRGYTRDFHYLKPASGHREFKIARFDTDWLFDELF